MRSCYLSAGETDADVLAHSDWLGIIAGRGGPHRFGFGCGAVSSEFVDVAFVEYFIGVFGNIFGSSFLETGLSAIIAVQFVGGLYYRLMFIDLIYFNFSLAVLLGSAAAQRPMNFPGAKLWEAIFWWVSAADGQVYSPLFPV